MDLSVIIVNYNGGTLILDTIRSVWATAKSMTMELIVVDNASTDDSMHKIQEQFGNRIIPVEMGRNAGFAAANNAGLKQASGTYVLFLNPDTVVLEGALQTLVRYMDTHPQTGACGANLFNNNMQPAFSYWTLLPGPKMEWSSLWSDRCLRRKHHGSQEHNHTGQPKEVAYIMGADLLVRKDVLDRVGPMDEDFFLFYEETELCYRIRKAGYHIVSVPEAQILHLEGQTINAMGIRQEQMMRSRDIYLRKCCSPSERMLANAILTFSCLVRIVCFGIGGNTNKVQFWKYTLQNIHP